MPARKRKDQGTIQTVQVRPQLGEKESQRDPSGFVTIVPMDSKRSTVRDLRDVLEEVAGVRVRSLGGLGASSFVSIRGSTSQQVQILLDGIPLNHKGSGAVDLSDLPVDGLKQVEIFRGFVPPHLGGAMGGAIQLLTLLPPKTLQARVETAFGSFRTMQGTLYVGHRHRHWSWSLRGKLLSTAGDFRYFDDRGTPYNEGDDLLRALRENNAMWKLSLLGGVMYRPSRRFQFRVQNLWMQRKQGVPGVGVYRSQQASYANGRNLLQMATDWRIPAQRMRWKNQLYWTHQHENYQDRLGEIGLGHQDTAHRVEAVGGKSEWSWFVSNAHEISASISFRYEGFWPYDQLSERQAPERHRGSGVASLQHVASFWEERVLVTLGGRLEGLFQPRIEEQKEQPEAFRWLPTGRLGVQFRPWPWLELRSNLGRYVRVPTFWEWFGDQGVMVGNPRLRPEEGWMWDVGGALRWRWKSSFVRQVRLDYAFFWTEALDLIRFVQNSQSTMLAVNIAKARIRGHELRLRAAFVHGISIEGSLTWMDARNESNAPFERGKQLPGRPNQEWSLRVEWRGSWLHLFTRVAWLAGNFLDRANLQELAPRLQQHVGLAWWPARMFQAWGYGAPWTGLQVSLEIKNIWDQRMAQVALRPALPNRTHVSQALGDFFGYPLPGRAAYMSVRWAF